MSGGVVYLRHDPARGLDDGTLRDRFAKGAKVHMRAPRDEDVPALRELIEAYANALSESDQTDAGAHVRSLLDDPAAHFRVVRPGTEITDQTISTE
jgi:glutamate synthase (NADPH/NADH) large chain